MDTWSMYFIFIVDSHFVQIFCDIHIIHYFIWMLKEITQQQLYMHNVDVKQSNDLVKMPQGFVWALTLTKYFRWTQF